MRVGLQPAALFGFEHQGLELISAQTVKEFVDDGRGAGRMPPLHSRESRKISHTRSSWFRVFQMFGRIFEHMLSKRTILIWNSPNLNFTVIPS
jgi:hypothetical protein